MSLNIFTKKQDIPKEMKFVDYEALNANENIIIHTIAKMLNFIFVFFSSKFIFLNSSLYFFTCLYYILNTLLITRCLVKIDMLF